jgi:hypothetical protein
MTRQNPICPKHQTEMRYPSSNRDQNEQFTLRGKKIPNKFHFCAAQDCKWRFSSELSDYFEADELPQSHPGGGAFHAAVKQHLWADGAPLLFGFSRVRDLDSTSHKMIKNDSLRKLCYHGANFGRFVTIHRSTNSRKSFASLTISSASVCVATEAWS